jgi:tRNA1(Val) A37 N6-methylase TrmN6
MSQQLEIADKVRRQVARLTARKHKVQFGQYMTPSSIARFMAEMFPPSDIETCILLDAGAGVGALSCAFLDRWKNGGFDFQSVEAYAFEIDGILREHLTQHLAVYKDVQAHVIADDFIEMADQPLFQGENLYTHAILNPPYKKINSVTVMRSDLLVLKRSISILHL